MFHMLSKRPARTSRTLMAVAALLTMAVAGAITSATAYAGAEPGGNAPDAAASRAAVAAAPLDDPRFAVVQPGTPNLVRGRNAVSARRLATGNYEVIFDRDVRNCAYVGSPGTVAGGNPQGGQIAVAQRSGNPNGVYVDTRDDEGFTADRVFHLVVVC